MDVTFQKNTCPCLRRVACQIQNQEQTQEVRLPESMPDIGTVLGSWGQVLIRGKEWRSGSMAVSGGVQTWVLYAPEDGSQPQSVETWIPFQMKWDLDDSKRDGTICVVPVLRTMDARTTSARKLMLRANVSLLGQALEPSEPEVCCPGQIPEDVQLLKKSYPSELPVEAGEKLFEMDEELILPGNLPSVERILRYTLMPEVIEQKVMAGRLVFRGKARLHMVYSGDDGRFYSWDHEVPFSQFTELDSDHSVNASGWVLVILTGMELERLDERKLSLKASMAAQYVIYDRVMLELVEDAYSPVRQVTPQMEQLRLPVRLDSCVQQLDIRQSIDAEGIQCVDVCFQPEHPDCCQDADVAEIRIPGQFTLLYYDTDGELQSKHAQAEGMWQISSDMGNTVDAYVCSASPAQAVFAGDTAQMSVGIGTASAIFSEKGLPMVTGLELGEIGVPDPQRPSLVLRRAGDGSIWDIAKACGSTVDAIRKANQIEEEPESGRMLLVPVN